MFTFPSTSHHYLLLLLLMVVENICDGRCAAPRCPEVICSLIRDAP